MLDVGADAFDLQSSGFIEAQMSKIWKREPFRHHSYVSRAATRVAAGLGALGYELALTAVARLIAEQAQQ